MINKKDQKKDKESLHPLSLKIPNFGELQENRPFVFLILYLFP